MKVRPALTHALAPPNGTRGSPEIRLTSVSGNGSGAGEERVDGARRKRADVAHGCGMSSRTVGSTTGITVVSWRACPNDRPIGIHVTLSPCTMNTDSSAWRRNPASGRSLRPWPSSVSTLSGSVGLVEEKSGMDLVAEVRVSASVEPVEPTADSRPVTRGSCLDSWLS